MCHRNKTVEPELGPEDCNDAFKPFSPPVHLRGRMHVGWAAALTDQSPETEDDLIDGAMRGVRTSFEGLYRLHVRAVYTYLAYNVPLREDAEELTQEVFVRAWNKLSQFRNEATFATWLMAIAVSTCRMWHRARGSRVREVELGEIVAETLAGAAAQRSSHPYSVEVLDLRRAIGSLPPRARSVLVLHELSGYRHREIANIMKISVGASKAQLNRAKRLLAEELNDG